MNSEIAFIIGNGTSRKAFDLLDAIQKLGENRPVIYGCNALYREFKPNYEIPDILIAIDSGAIAEIRSSDFPSQKVIIPPENEHWEPKELHPNGERPRANAGMCAMREAVHRGAKVLLCLGFDSFLKDANQSVSNLFDGTTNYGPETRASVWDNPGRTRYMSYFAKHNPNVDFIFVYPSDMEAVQMGERNVYQTSYEEMMRSFE